MTFLEIRQEAADRLGLSQTLATNDARRFRSYANRWHRKILSAPLMDGLRRVTLTQASVASQASYGIALKDILYVTERDNDLRLYPKSLAWYREHYPDPSQFTGTPRFYVELGRTRVHTQPANASQLFVKSTEAADTGTVYVEVIRSTGYRATLSVTLTGVTAVTLSATITDVVAVNDVFLSVAQTGVVTLHEDSGTGTELSRIPIGQTYPRFLRYALAPTPSAVITYYLDGVVDIPQMAQDTDEPLVPPDFHDLLVDGIVHDEWQSKGREPEARVLRGEIDRRIRELRLAIRESHEHPEEGDGRRSFEDLINLPIS